MGDQEAETARQNSIKIKQKREEKTGTTILEREISAIMKESATVGSV